MSPLPYIPKTLEDAISLLLDIQRDIDKIKGIKGKLSHKDLKDIEDHDNYIKLDGTRPFIAPIDMGGNDIKGSSHPALNIRDFSTGEIIQRDRGLVVNFGSGVNQINTDKIPEGQNNWYVPNDLTATRVPFVDANGRLVDDADLTFITNTLIVTKIAGHEITGDTSFLGSGVGLPYGSCWGNEIAWTQAAAVQNTWYKISDTDMTDGKLNNVIHDGSGKLTLAIAGTYLVNYACSAEASAANVHIQMAIALNGTEQNDGIQHYETKAVSKQFNMSGIAILTVTAGQTIEISTRTTDAGTPDISVDHLNISVVQVGG